MLPMVMSGWTLLHAQSQFPAALEAPSDFGDLSPKFATLD